MESGLEQKRVSTEVGHLNVRVIQQYLFGGVVDGFIYFFLLLNPLPARLLLPSKWETR